MIIGKDNKEVLKEVFKSKKEREMRFGKREMN